MFEKTFRGGVHPGDNKKNSNKLPIENLKAPKELVFPVSQHIGAPCEPVVSVGDEVKMGQLIAKAGGFVSANIYSSVSGVVTAIKPHIHPNGTEVNSIFIENDGKDEPFEEEISRHLKDMEPEEIISAIQKAGIVGMGGATFPTHVKLSPPEDKIIDTVIVNGAECEPYLTSDHRVLLEETFDVLYGLASAMKALGVKRGVVAVENNKKDAIEALNQTVEKARVRNVKIEALKTKYPQGSEKQLIYAVTGREVPSGKLPSDVGVVVINVDTANAIAKAVRFDRPLMTRIVTVCGDAVKNHKNYRVRIGTPVKNLIEEAGGFEKEPSKIILGGPMMGTAIFSTDVPVIKGTGAVLCMTDKMLADLPATKCLRCGRCVDVCPMHLQPYLIAGYSEKFNPDMLKSNDIMDCMECGACSYICPARYTPLQHIRTGKAKLRRLGGK